MWALILASTVLGAAAQVELRTTSGESLVGTLTELNAEGVSLQTADGPVTMTVDQIAGLTSNARLEPSAPKSSVWVELVDGSRLACAEYTVKSATARMKLLDGQQVEIKTRRIATVRFREQGEEILRQWEQIAAEDHAEDVLITRKKDVLDFVSGTLGDAAADAVQFKLDDEKISVKRSRIEGLIYWHPAADELPAAFCQVSHESGARVQVASARIEEGQLLVTTPSGLELSLSLARLASIDFKVQYLSDLKPTSQTWTSFWGDAEASPTLVALYKPRMNRGFSSDQLHLGGKSYAKGLALHSRSEMIYLLDGKSSRLRAIAGIDDLARPAGSVKLVIQGDDRSLFEQTLSGQDAPLSLDVDLKGVRRLTILVDFGDGQDSADFLDLCDARILQ